MINADEGSTRQHDIRDLWGLSPDTSLTGARWLTKFFPILQRRTEIIDEWLTLPTIRPHMSFAQDRLRNQEAYEAGIQVARWSIFTGTSFRSISIRFKTDYS